MIRDVIYILVIIVFVVLAGLFAGSETGAYQLSQMRLRLGLERKKFSFVVLSKVLRDSGAFLISVLIGTNLSCYIVTSLVTLLLLQRLESEHTVVLFATLITAPVLFVFSELIPKNLFFYRADSLMPYVAPVLLVFHRLCCWCGIVALFKGLSRLFHMLTGSVPSSRTALSTVRSWHIKAIFYETAEEGLLSPVQTDIINRLTSISHLSIKSVMTAWHKVRKVAVNTERAEMLEELKKYPFTRLPVWESRSTNAVGFVNIYDCLSNGEEFEDMRGFLKPIRRCSASTSVIDAINIMKSENQKIMLVTRAGHGGTEKPVGVVTMKDLVEELLGELAEW